MISAREAYLGMVKKSADIARANGLINWLDARAGRGHYHRWARSLFAIYDIEQMISLDIPWWTFEAIDRVDQFLRDRSSARIFEYGSGASTIWLARRARSVISVEHDPNWHPVVRAKAEVYKNVTVILEPADPEPNRDPIYRSTKRDWKGRSFHNYVHAIERFDTLFDMIVIDGRARPACLRLSQSKLVPGGLIVFDNTHRRAYRRAITESGMHAKRTRGLTACLPYPDETTLLT